MIIDVFIRHLQILSSESLSIATLVVCYVAILLYKKFWGLNGLYSYVIIAVIASNIQVLKGAYFKHYEDPIALGTIVYSTTFLASDAITEFYGVRAAKQCIWMSFGASFLMLALMFLTIGYGPLSETDNLSSRFNIAHAAIETIFKPAPSIFLASLIAYGTSQLTDIFIFSRIRNYTAGRYLGFRAFFSVAIASLIDALVFNGLAWKIFSPTPLSWQHLTSSYIIPNYMLQIIIALLNIPTFYLLKKIKTCTADLNSK